jgi:hypothetical protein
MVVEDNMEAELINKNQNFVWLTLSNKVFTWDDCKIRVLSPSLGHN